MPEPCQHPEAVVVDVASDADLPDRRSTRVRLVCTVCGVAYAETRDDPHGTILLRARDALFRREILRPVRQIDG